MLLRTLARVASRSSGSSATSRSFASLLGRAGSTLPMACRAAAREAQAGAPSALALPAAARIAPRRPLTYFLSASEPSEGPFLRLDLPYGAGPLGLNQIHDNLGARPPKRSSGALVRTLCSLETVSLSVCSL